MTNDVQNRTETQYGAPAGERRSVEARLGTDDRPDSVANNGRTNWAWAKGGSSYDWMDSHYLPTDVA